MTEILITREEFMNNKIHDEYSENLSCEIVNEDYTLMYGGNILVDTYYNYDCEQLEIKTVNAQTNYKGFPMYVNLDLINDFCDYRTECEELYRNDKLLE